MMKKCFSCRLFHIDDIPSGAGDSGLVDFRKALHPTRDPICCVCISDKMLVVVCLICLRALGVYGFDHMLL